MEYCCAEREQPPVVIVSEENVNSQLSPHHSESGSYRRDEAEACPGLEESTSSMEQQPMAALPALTHDSQLPPTRGEGSRRASAAPELTALSPEEAALPFSKEVITFSLFGRIHPKCKRPWNESLSARIAEVQDCYKNIPPKLYFSPSSVSLEGIGVYAAEMLPQDTSLGPYIGHVISRDQIDGEEHNEWLWEVYDNHSLAYFIDASDPKMSNHNWMNFIQCARNCTEQNLKLTQINENLYFVATRDIVVGEELLVWYDEVQYGVYMGVPTGFSRNRAPIIESAAMEPGVQHEPNTSHTLSTTAFPLSAHSSIGLALSSRNDQRMYVQYIHQPPVVSTGHLSDSASTDDSGISLSMEHSGGGRTPPGGLTSNFDRVSNSSGSSTHLDVTSTASKEAYHHPHVHEVAVYQPAEIYGNAHLPTLAPAGSPLSGTASSPHWMGGASKGELGGGEVWMKTSAQSGSVGLSGGARKQLLYGMFSRYEDGTRWQCEECKKLFSSQGSLRAHARIHTGERPYQCQYCCRTFCQASTLRSHERLHTGEKPYKCEHCGRAFTQSAGLRSHLKTHRYDS